MILSLEQKQYKTQCAPLTQTQHEILYGMILGDAFIGIHRNCKHARIQFAHGPAQIEFIHHLFDVFKTYTWMKQPKISYSFDKGYNVRRTHVHFETFSHPLFMPIYNAFYATENGIQPRVKVIPQHVDTWLTARVLAYHVMCDGSSTNRILTIATHGFTSSDSQRYVDAINCKFGLRGKVCIQWRRKNQKQYPFLRFPVSDFTKLKSLLQPYFLPLFHYKLES